MTDEIKRRVFGMCSAGMHGACIGGYTSVRTVDGIVLPAMECTCDCGHPNRREREVGK